MALQKRRRGPARTGHQRSAWMKKSGENAPQVQACPNCQAMKITHHICQACGFYGGKQIIQVNNEA